MPLQLPKLLLVLRFKPGPALELAAKLESVPASVPASVLASVLASASGFAPASASGSEELLGTAVAATSFTAAEASSCSRDLLARSP